MRSLFSFASPGTLARARFNSCTTSMASPTSVYRRPMSWAGRYSQLPASTAQPERSVFSAHGEHEARKACRLGQGCHHIFGNSLAEDDGHLRGDRRGGGCRGLRTAQHVQTRPGRLSRHQSDLAAL